MANKGHDNIKPPVKGEVRNPKGKAKGTLNRATIVRRIIEALAEGRTDGFNKFEVATLEVLNKAMGGDVTAWDKLADSAYGKVSDKVESTGKDGAALFPATVAINVVKPDTKLGNDQN